MSYLTLRVDTGDTDTFVAGTAVTDANAENTANNVSLLFKSLAGGARTKAASVRYDAAPVAATGTFTSSSGNGTQTAIINGVSIAITWATDDTISAALMAAAINASTDPLVLNFVTATSALGVVTVTAVEKGIVSNAMTTTATGTGFTAGQARLTGGTRGTVTSFAY